VRTIALSPQLVAALKAAGVRMPACTTPGTLLQLCCSPRGSTSAWPWRSSVTPRSA
jgi:hypothetical protein